MLLLPILSLLLNQNNQMDSNASGFLLNNSILHSVYYQTKEDNGIIDLGFSLRTLQPEAYHPSRHSKFALFFFLVFSFPPFIPSFFALHISLIDRLILSFCLVSSNVLTGTLF